MSSCLADMRTYLSSTRLRAKSSLPSTSSKMDASWCTRYEQMQPSLDTSSASSSRRLLWKSDCGGSTPGRSRFTSSANSRTLLTMGVAERHSSLLWLLAMWRARKLYTCLVLRARPSSRDNDLEMKLWHSSMMTKIRLRALTVFMLVKNLLWKFWSS
nr:MAG: hypothetical protein [Molluscum contagiosum virus]